MRSKKDLPENFTSQSKQLFSEISKIEPLTHKLIFNNQAKLDEYNAVYESAIKFLNAGEHDEVFEAFALFFEQDLKLKEEIARALMPQSQDEFVSEETLTNLIELQGFASNFRIRLLEGIAGKLIDLYDQSNNFFQSGNLEKGAMLTNKATSLYNFYVVRLKRYEAPLDDYRGAMFFECKSSLDVVKASGDRNLAQMTNSVLQRESELTGN